MMDKGRYTTEKPVQVMELEKMLGIEFYLHKNTGSCYGIYNDTQIRLSNHSSKFPEKTGGIDLIYTNRTGEDLFEKIKGERSFLKQKKEGDLILHKRLGEMIFVSYDTNKVTVLFNGELKKYYDDVFVKC